MDDSLTGCSLASHAAIKQDPARWSQLAYVGVQHTPADEYGPAEALEMRNCRCGSTLCKPIATVWTWRNVTAAHRGCGFRNTTFIELVSSDGWTLLSFDDDGDITVLDGTPIDWADVVVADVRGKRQHEEDLSVGEQSVFARMREVA